MGKGPYSKKIVEAIKNFLIKDGWNFSFDECQGVFIFELSLKGRINRIKYVISIDKNYYIVYAISPISVEQDDEKRMLAMSEFVCRANYGLKSGCFELGMDDGEIRFKNFVGCQGIVPTMKMIRDSIHIPAAMFDQYSSGLVNIILGDTIAKDEIARCEKNG